MPYSQESMTGRSYQSVVPGTQKYVELEFYDQRKVKRVLRFPSKEQQQ